MKKKESQDIHPINKSVVNYNMIGSFFDFSTLPQSLRTKRVPRNKK